MVFRFWSRSVATLMVCLAGLALARDASAQSTGMFGSSGALSGSNGFGAGTTGSSGSTAFGSNALPSNSLPSTAMPSTALPSTGLPGMTGATGATGQAGATGQRAGLVGQTSTRLAGVAAAGPQGTVNQMQQGQGQRGGQRGGQNQNQNQNNQQPQRSIRPQLVVAFNPPIPTAESMTTKISTRFKKMTKMGYENVTVEMDGRHAILRGEVDSAQAKRMAKMLVKLEPGVKTVQNDITVKGE